MAIFLTPTTQLYPSPVYRCVCVDRSQKFIECEYDCNGIILR